MPYQVIILGRRKPGVSFEEFKNHYETGHIPLIKELVGPDFPATHERFYFSRAPDGSDEPALMLGPPEGEKPADSVSILTFDDEAHFQRCGTMWQDEAKAARIRADEDKFVDRGSFTMVVVGEVGKTTR